MSKNTPTILLEAGHHPNDFGRNIVVHEIHKSLLMFLNLFVSENEINPILKPIFNRKNYDHLETLRLLILGAFQDYQINDSFNSVKF